MSALVFILLDADGPPARGSPLGGGCSHLAMPAPTVQEIKKALVQAGYEVYRARGDEIQLAERPRENLIMDAGVSLVASEPVKVRFVVRAQRADFPGEDEAALFERARGLGRACVDRGYVEFDTRARTLFDPGDSSRVLDTWYEVFFERPMSSLTEALDEVMVVLQFEKAATR